MKNKQTAVEWLESELESKYMFDGFAWEDRAYFMKLLEQAKAMEKEQIMVAYDEGDIQLVNAEQYYNETYNKKDHA